jgi:ubiquinone/menaquinone biosynthesis C-methylase UbiE
MASGLVTNIIHRLLAVPLVFDVQQALCNNYGGVRAEFADYLNKDGLKILDVGCSTGASAASVVDMERQDYTGIEIVPEYAVLAAKRNPKSRVLVMDARKMEFLDNSFDVVYFLGVWHHMDDGTVRDSLAEVRRVLKPNGLLLVAEPLFTPGRWYSNVLLRGDRGKYIRSEDGYLQLAQGWRVHRKRTFRFSLHRFLSLVLAPNG